MKESKYIGKDTNGNYYINITKLIFVDEIKNLSSDQLIDKYELTQKELRDIIKYLNKSGFSIDKRRDHELIISDKNIIKLYSRGMSKKNLASINDTSYRIINRIVKDVDVIDKPNLMKSSLLRLMAIQIKQWLSEGLTHQQISDKLLVVDRSTVSKFIRSLNLGEKND